MGPLESVGKPTLQTLNGLTARPLLLVSCQVAAMELGKVLGRGPLPLACIRVGDTASDAHPNNGSSWSSTASESSCEVRTPPTQNSPARLHTAG